MTLSAKKILGEYRVMMGQYDLEEFLEPDEFEVIGNRILPYKIHILKNHDKVFLKLMGRYICEYHPIPLNYPKLLVAIIDYTFNS